MITREEIYNIVKGRFNSFDEKITDNGSLLLGNLNKSKPYKWLVSIFAPLKSDILLKSCKVSVPTVYKDFLINVANGISLFSGTLSLEGIRTEFSREPKIAFQQPLDFSLPNTDERPKNSKDSYFFFGFYDWDGSRVYINTLDNKVYLCKRDDATPLKSWESFDEYIIGEIRRINNLFDEFGNQIDDDTPTTPL